MLTKLIPIVAVVSILIVAAVPEKQDKPILRDGGHPCEDIEDGSPCDPEEIKCDQCSWCVNKTSFYYRCKQVKPDNPFLLVVGVWNLEACPPGYLVDPTKPLASGLQGGQCTAWDDLDATTITDYLKMPDCKVRLYAN